MESYKKSALEHARVGDLLGVERRERLDDGAAFGGILDVVVFDADGAVKWHQEIHNLITQVGDQYYGERAAGIAGAPAQATGMKLGTGSTAASKTGAGAALITYHAASNKLFDGGFPASSLNGASRQIQWKVSWTAGVINGVALREAVIVNDAAIDATSSTANTYARALFGPMTLGVSDTLAITWSHLLLGA